MRVCVSFSAIAASKARALLQQLLFCALWLRWWWWCMLLHHFRHHHFSRVLNIHWFMDCCHYLDPHQFYTHDIFRVKFGVPLDQVCKRDIPGPLLVSYLFLIAIHFMAELAGLAWVGRHLFQTLLNFSSAYLGNSKMVDFFANFLLLNWPVNEWGRSPWVFKSTQKMNFELKWG